MTKYARIIDGEAIDVIDFDPFSGFTNEVALTFVTVPDETETSDRLNHDGSWTKYVAPVVTPYVEPPVRTLTKLAYMNRFTDAELAGIYTAAKTVIQVEIWLEKFKLAQEINLDDTYTIGGLQAMEASGLIGVGRANEILS